MGLAERREKIVNGLRPIRRALVSVSDKTGLGELLAGLKHHGIEIISTGGTAQAIAQAGYAATDISRITGFPEILDGRVKTLHPAVHGGILAKRGDPNHQAALVAHDIAPIDLIVVNLYPFAKTLHSGADDKTVIENIDIGGPAMIRAAAKNYGDVAVLTDPKDYAALLVELQTHGGQTTLGLRQKLARQAFALTAAYDGMIAHWLGAGDALPPALRLAGDLAQELRYGENPHQRAGFYRTHGSGFGGGIGDAVQVQGKELSYNNLLDADAALECVAEFTEPAAVIVKHANPCGAAVGGDILIAYQNAYRCDPISAFGGIVAVNRALDEDLAKAVTQIFTEIVIAPAADAAARAVFAKKPNLRLLLLSQFPDADQKLWQTRSLRGGLLYQERDTTRITAAQLKIVSQKKPDAAQIADLLFAATLAKHIKSNAIIYAKDGASLGIGAGQMSRIDSTRIAKIKADERGLNLHGAVAASDAFFPFADGVEVIAQAGIKAIIQPGGSVRDDEVIAAADHLGLVMAFSGIRNFRH
jgi:phosphoribosylaminoimidazolecarboxamide formyltransferase / IMP cyclohydrolase